MADATTETLVKGVRDALDRLYHHAYTPLSRGQQWEAGCRELDALAARLREATFTDDEIARMLSWYGEWRHCTKEDDDLADKLHDALVASRDGGE